MLRYIIFLAISSISLANNCTDVDLRKTQKLTQDVRNQGKMSWCYAHTAADLVQFHFNSKPLSAADLAINYSSHFAAKFVHALMNISTLISSRPTIFMEPQTGFIKASLNQSFDLGFCPKHIFTDEKIKMVNLSSGESKEVDYALAMFDILKNVQPAIKSGEHVREKMYEFSGLANNDFLKILKESNRQAVFDNIADKICDTHRIKFIKPQVIQKLRSSNMFSDIDQQLDQENIIAFDYNASVLKNKDKASLIPNNLHTSSIVGRRWNQENNSCEYLIRNSFGADCKYYDKSYTCEKGNIWIPKKYLQKSILLLTYLR